MYNYIKAMFMSQIVHISDKILHQGQAESVLLPGVQGEFELRDLHGSLVALLGPGTILIRLAAGAEPKPGEAGLFKQISVEIATDAQGRHYKSMAIEQGLVRFDGKKMFAVVE